MTVKRGDIYYADLSPVVGNEIGGVRMCQIVEVYAEENLVRLRDILSELESHVGPLKIQSEKAQKFLEYAGEKKNLEIGLWLYTIEKTKNDLREYEKKITITEAQYNEVCKVLEEITKNPQF